MGRNNKAKKPKKKNKQKTSNEVKENGLYSIQIAMATQLTAFVDVTGCDIDVMEEMMELAIQYQNNLIENYNHIKEMTDALYEKCGINIDIDPRNFKPVLPQQFEYIMRKYREKLAECARLQRIVNELKAEKWTDVTCPNCGCELHIDWSEVDE